MTISNPCTSNAEGPEDLRAGNSYDFVRFCAASAVLFSHHFDLAGFPEPVVPGYGGDFGELGVEIFFCLSGFLICLSLQRSRNWVRFAAARILRIFPNLLFVLVVTSAVTLVWYDNLANLETHLDYVGENLLMFVKGVTQVIPDVFEDTLRPQTNEPLWTLPYEVWLYVLLALIFLMRGPLVDACIAVAAVLVSIGWCAEDITGEFMIGPLEAFELFRLGSFFLSGAVLAMLWPHAKQHATAIGIAGLFGVFLFCNLLPIDTILTSLSFAAAVVGLGSSRAMAWFAKGGDASYGVYLFAWPVQQFALLLIGSFWLSMLAAFVVTVALGYGTWHAFEKRAMGYADRIGRIAWRTSPGVKVSVG
jgi:peptidoglycan/LPS O-acetylase OafA/YrhL